MTKQEAYAELRKKLDDINDLLADARDFADKNELVMSHKDNSNIVDSYGEYYPNVGDFLEVTTLEEGAVSDWKDKEHVREVESEFDYGWMPSSIRC